MDASKRTFLQFIGSVVIERLMSRNLAATLGRPAFRPNRRLILVITGGLRRQETFSEKGKVNIPHLCQDFLPSAVFYSSLRNDGVTSHFNSISSILTGNWQRVDDWGKEPPSSPTLFEYARKQTRFSPSEVWMVSSNKVISDRIAASSRTSYGPLYGANVVFPKALLVAAVEEAIRKGHRGSLADRAKVRAELEAVLQSNDYEGMTWNITENAQGLEGSVQTSVRSAIERFVQANSPTTGDQLTHYVAVEIMKQYAPSLLVVNFSDVEVAHFGSYSMHLAGIRNTDRLIYELWKEVEANPEYRGKTLMVVMPEFGRDRDGSNTNGFLNHRSNDAMCREIWMMCFGRPVGRSQVIERSVRQIDVCPSLASWLGCEATESSGNTLPELT